MLIQCGFGTHEFCLYCQGSNRYFTVLLYNFFSSKNSTLLICSATDSNIEENLIIKFLLKLCLVQNSLEALMCYVCSSKLIMWLFCNFYPNMI